MKLFDQVAASMKYITAFPWTTITRTANQIPAWPTALKKKFPNIDFTKSIMIGDKLGDMQLGRNIGAFTVLIPSLHSENLEGHPDVDAVFRSLYEFTMEIKS